MVGWGPVQYGKLVLNMNSQYDATNVGWLQFKCNKCVFFLFFGILFCCYSFLELGSMNKYVYKKQQNTTERKKLTKILDWIPNSSEVLAL